MNSAGASTPPIRHGKAIVATPIGHRYGCLGGRPAGHRRRRRPGAPLRPPSARTWTALADDASTRGSIDRAAPRTPAAAAGRRRTPARHASACPKHTGPHRWPQPQAARRPISAADHGRPGPRFPRHRPARCATAIPAAPGGTCGVMVCDCGGPQWQLRTSARSPPFSAAPQPASTIPPTARSPSNRHTDGPSVSRWNTDGPWVAVPGRGSRLRVVRQALRWRRIDHDHESGKERDGRPIL